MTTNIRPDITDLEQEAVNKILEILLYKQGKLFKEQKMEGKEQQADKLLDELQSYIRGENKDVEGQ